MSDTEEISQNLYVVGLPLDFTEDDLYELFSSHGKLEDCKCLPAKEGKTTKAGFANFECVEDSKNAFDYFSIKENNPLQLVIGYSKRKRVNVSTSRMADTNSAHGKASLDRKQLVSPNPMTQPTRSESPLFDNREEKFQRSPEDSCRGFKEYPNSQQPIISFPETPISRAMSFTSETGAPPHFDHLPRNIHNFQSGREKSIESRGKDIVISVRNVKNDVVPSVEMKIICVICGTSAFFCCGRCKSIYYCGEECQIIDWVENDHRADCFKYEHSSPFQNFSETASISSLDATNLNYMASIEGASTIRRNSSPRPSRIFQKDIPSVPLRKPRILDSIASHKLRGEPKPHSLKSSTIPKILGSHAPQKTEEIATKLPAQSLREEEKVLACYGSNPYKFYVQKLSDLEDLTYISVTLNSKSRENSSTVRVNSLCAAKYTDGEWYRVRIDKVCDDGLNVEAFFLDFGNTDIVPISNLSEISKDLLNFSAKAYCVRLMKVKPLNHAKDFSSESLEKISELLKVPYTVKKSIFTIEGIFTVELEDDNGNNLSTLLLEKKIADPVSIYLIKTEKSTSKENSKEKPCLIKLDPQCLNYLDEVILCYGNDPRNFYVQKISDFEELLIISEELKKQSNEPLSLGEFRVGSICAAKYTDGLWYRAEIIVKNSSGKCRVFFVDFGNDEVVSTSDLKSISHTLSFSPKAFRCSLYKSNCHEFTESVKNELQNSGATVKEVRKNGRTYEVELISKISMEDISTLLNKSKSDEQPKNQFERHPDETKPNPVNTGRSRATDVPNEVQSIIEVPQQMVSVSSESKSDPIDIPKNNLVPGDQVLLCHGSNPRCFYVNKESEYQEFALLNEQLQTSSLSSKLSIPPQIDLICAVLSEDGLWYRSRIEKILDDGKVQAFLIDFGNEITVDASSLRPLPKALFAYSPKAYCLQLKVKPLNGEAKFSSEVENFFKNLINDYTLTVVKSSRIENSFEVELKDEEENDIAALLTTCQLVELICNDVKNPAESEDMPKPIKETSSSLIVPSLSESLSEQKEEKVTPKAVLLPKKSSLPEQKLVIGDKVTLVYGRNPSNFYVCKLSEDDEIKMIGESLQTKMSVKKEILTEPREGLMCCAIFEDNLWYRARIQKILENEKAKILFVDFGNEEVVNVSELLELPEDLLRYAAKAFCLKLKVKPLNNSEDFTNEVQESFYSFINGYPLIVKECVQNGSVFIVDLKDEEENDIGNLLVSMELADLLSDCTPISKPSTKETEAIAQTVINTEQEVLSTVPLPEVPDLPQQTLASGDKVKLVYGKNPSNFYANKVSEFDEILKISELLQSQKSMNEAKFSPQVGLLCSALFEDDNLLYRGKVEKVLEDGKVEILFVDYGNKALCSTSMLRELPKELLSYSAKAYSLKLKVKPLNGASQFPDEVQETFSSFIEGYTLIVKECVQSGSSFIVDLKDEKDNDIAGVLISSKLAVPFNDNTPSAKNNVTLTNIQSSDEVAEVINPVITPEKQRNEPEKLATSTDNASVCDLPQQCLSSGDKVVLVFENDPLGFYVNRFSDFDDIETISKRLENPSSAKQDSIMPTKGMLCCAQFKEDDLWYRARILNILGDETVKVSFLDYGNEEIVELVALRALPKDLLEFCAKAFCLKLKVKPLNGTEFSTEIRETFNNLIKGYPLIVTDAKKTGSKYIVSLKDEENNDIADLLVNNELALPDDETVPNENEAALPGDSAPIPNQPESAPVKDITQPTVLCTNKNVVSELPKQTLIPGDQVIIVYGSGPTKFYAHKFSDTNEIGLITKVLEDQLSLNTQTDSLTPQVGLLCSALYEDGLLYRAQITEILQNGKVKLFFTDFGNEEISEASSLRELPKELMAYSAKAYCIYLKSSKPLDFQKELPTEVQKAFETYTNILECSPCDTGFIVKLEDVETSTERDVSQSPKEDAISQPLQTLPQQQLIIGDEIATSFFEGPLCFYVTKMSDIDEINKISEYLKNQSPSTKSTDFIPTSGVLCIAKYSDGDWYRARVDEIINTETVKVYFVDYGNSEVIKVNSIAALPDEMLKYSSKVFQVRLSQIKPSNSSKDFSKEAIARCVALLQELPLIVTSVVKSGLFFDIRVINKAKKDIADILIEEKFAEAVRAEDVSRSALVKVDPQSSTHPSQIANEPKTNDQTSTKPSSLPKMSFMEGLPSSLPLEKLQTGVDYEVIVSWVLEPYIYVQMQSRFAELQKLELNLGYSSNLTKDNEHLPEVGDYVCSKYIDEKWYRSRVTSVASPDSVEVFFLDFGNSHKVTQKDVLPLPKSAFKIPALAHCVRIEGVKEINEEFARLLINENWTMQVSSLDPKNLGDVEAIVTFKSDSEITNKMLRCQIHPYSNSSLPPRKLQTSQKIKVSIETRSFEKGDQVSLEVLDISDIDALTCRVIDEKVTDGKSFETLMEEIQTHCSKTSQSLNYKPDIHDFVLAKNPDDRKWYRANVVMPVTGKKVAVSYVDLLDIAMVPVTDVLPMIEKLASIPCLGLVCSVYGINEENWENFHGQLKAFLKVRNNIIKAEVRQFGGANGTCCINIKETRSRIKTLENRVIFCRTLH